MLTPQVDAIPGTTPLGIPSDTTADVPDVDHTVMLDVRALKALIGITTPKDASREYDGVNVRFADRNVDGSIEPCVILTATNGHMLVRITAKSYACNIADATHWIDRATIKALPAKSDPLINADTGQIVAGPLMLTPTPLGRPFPDCETVIARSTEPPTDRGWADGAIDPTVTVNPSLLGSVLTGLGKIAVHPVSMTPTGSGSSPIRITATMAEGAGDILALVMPMRSGR